MSVAHGKNCTSQIKNSLQVNLQILFCPAEEGSEIDLLVNFAGRHRNIDMIASW